MTPFLQHRLFALATVAWAVAGCATTEWTQQDKTDAAIGAAIGGVAGHQAVINSVIPDRTLHISPSVTVTLEKLVFWGAYAGAAYLILDPLAPNWEIEQAAFPDSHYHFSLKMKRLYAGGAGESRMVFHQRAKELMRQGGYDGYQVLEYSEGMESSMLGSQRVSQGVIRLTRR